MVNKKEKIKILYIAKNIPTPKRKSNRIIFDIAHNLSQAFSIQFLYPKEIVPFWLRNKKKFTHLIKIKKWTYEGFEITPIPYFHLPIKKMQYWTLFYLPLAFNKITQTIKKTYLVHAHFLFPDGFMAYRLYIKYNIPYVITFRNSDRKYLDNISTKNPDYQKAEKILLNAKVILTPNGGYKEFVESRFNVKCRIMPHGIEQEIFEQEKIIKPNNIISILTVADKLSTKNVDWVIKAFLEYDGNKEIQLRLVGNVCNREDIRFLAKDNDQINLLGKTPREKVLALMRKSDIFALPSCMETFGLVYLEAAATLNAIIGYKGEGVWGVFEEDKEMLFCENYHEFKEQLYKLINEEKLCCSLQTNAYLKAQKMKWSNIIKLYEEAYSTNLTTK